MLPKGSLVTRSEASCARLALSRRPYRTPRPAAANGRIHFIDLFFVTPLSLIRGNYRNFFFGRFRACILELHFRYAFFTDIHKNRENIAP